VSAASPFRLDGRVALVTGANSGIGQAIAVAMARAGAEVVCAARRAPEATLARIAEAGGRGRGLHLDLSDPLAADAVFAGAGIDILVNNAGIIRRADAVAFGEADWDAVMDVDLKALFFTTQAFGREALKRGGGAVVNIASVLSFQGGIRVPAYTAAKHGVAGLTRALANEWARHGVNVNAIAPGYVETDNTAALQADAARYAAIVERIPAGRWGQPDDIAGAAVFLASPAARYIHGAILNVDGGWLAR
jgi:2-deoxy-D-gluconate 3-dehydrogenase